MYKVFRNLLDEADLIKLEKVFRSYTDVEQWKRSEAVSSQYGSVSSTSSRIARFLTALPSEIPISIRHKIEQAITELSDKKYHFMETWSIQRYLDTEGGKFNWHQDNLNFFLYHPGDENKTAEELFIANSRPKRAISISIALNDREEYDGGQFVIDVGDSEQTPIDLDRGDACIFTSETFHGVNPVTSGERNALIIWLVDYEEYIEWSELCDIAIEKV